MNERTYILSEALRVAVEALQTYASAPRGLPGGSYSAMYFDAGNHAEEALAKIGKLLDKLGYRGGGEEGNVL